MLFNPSRGIWHWRQYNSSSRDYGRVEATEANVIMSPVRWGMRRILEAPLAVWRNDEYDFEHDAVQLIRRPNPYYSGAHLIMAAVMSLWIDGNCYLLKVRDQSTLEPRELWFVPWWLIEPYSESENAFIEKYIYTVAGQQWDLSPDDVIHIRFGLDPHNVRLGLGGVRAVLREVFTDEEASNFAASIMINQGMPGAIISPEGDRIPQDQVDIINDYFKTQTRGDLRGNPVTLSRKVKVDTFGWEPSKLDLHRIRAIPEERVCALLGIPAAVVGFGTGLEQTKVGATLTELRQIAYEDAIIPTQRMITEELDKSLLAEFTNDRTEHFIYDLSNVKALQEDEGEKIGRINRAVVGGWLPVNVAQQLSGFPVDDSQAVYIRRMQSTEVPAQTASRGSVRLKRELSNRAKEYYDYQQRERIRLDGIFGAELVDRFTEWGNRIGNEVERLARERLEAGRNGGRSKAGEDAFLEAIGEQVVIDGYEQYGGEVLQYDRHFVRTTESVLHGLETIYERPSTLTPELEAEMVTLAKDRERLLDLKAQTRGAVTKAIRKGRIEGESLQQIADRIRKSVGAGPWSSAKTRAEVIARTETKLAQNLANVKASKEVGAEYFEIIDGQLPNSDEFCIARNGKIVQASQTETLAFSEHPNGTLSFAPYFDSESGADLVEDVRPEPVGGWSETGPRER